jgi:hypothetical protein
MVTNMSNETARKVAEAEALESEQCAKADERIRECLSGIASGLPGRIDKIAKRTALNQPEVAKTLGSEGLKVLRRELADSAQELAPELEGAADKIKWPQASSEYSGVSTRDIHSALFKFLHGPHVDKLAAVFKRHGFSVGDAHRDSQSLILPQDLYEEKTFAPVAEALNSLGKAQQDLASAKATHDQDTVASLWDNSELDG